MDFLGILHPWVKIGGINQSSNGQGCGKTVMTNKKSDKKSDREIIILMVISLAVGLVQIILGLIQVLK